MPRPTFRKTTSLLTAVVFLFSLAAPPPAQAVHIGSWYAGGTQIGVTYVSSVAEDDEMPPEPKHNDCGFGDPVRIATGEFYYECTDLMIPGRGLDLVLKHHYRSGRNFNGQFGYGWTINYHYRLRTVRGGNVVIMSGDGRKDEYTDNGDGTYAPPAGFFETLQRNTDGSWALTKAHGEVWTFELNGNLASIADRNGNTLTFDYDPGGLLSIIGSSKFVIDPLAPPDVVGFDYKLTRITDTMGRTVDLDYDANGRLQTVTDFAGREVAYTYNPGTGDLLTITRPATPQHPGGVTKTFTYNNAHNLETIKNENGQVFVRSYYSSSNETVTRQDLGGLPWTASYSVGYTNVRDRVGNDSTYHFNANGNPIQVEHKTRGLHAGAPGSYITSHTYNDDMLLTSTTFPRGNGVTYRYDEGNADPRAHGNLLEVRRKADMAQPDNDTLDLVTRVTYEPQFHLPKTITDPRGNVTTLTYDYELPGSDPDHGTAGNVVRVTAPSAGGTTPVTAFSYNTAGQVTEVRDPNGHVTRLSYDAATGYPVQVIRDPGGINAVYTITYDTLGNIDTVTDPLNRVTDVDYDALRRLVKEVNPLGYVTEYFYDGNGNLTRVERQANEADSARQIVQMTYTVLNKLATITDPLNRVTTFTYDKNDNVSAVTDPQNNATFYEYDERDLLYRVSDANTPQGVTLYDYDPNGNLAKITDAENHATTYAYDGFDRTTALTYAGGSAEQYAYDKADNLTQLTRPGGAVLNFVYDALNRRTAKQFAAAPALNVTYGYDAASRLVSAVTTAGSATYSYDALDRLVSSVQDLAGLPALTVGYAYDKAGNRTGLTYPSGKSVAYTYDPGDRLTAVTVDGTAAATYDYDPLDRRVQRDYAGGTERSTYGYDLADQLLQVQHLAGGSVKAQFNYTYSAAGNRLSQAALTGTQNYAYNAIYELTGVTGSAQHNYAYDNVGNRVTADGVAYTSNGLNQYTQAGGVSFTYDGQGNLTGDGTNLYGYDADNRLTSATAGAVSGAYQFDAFGRRVKKSVTGTGGGDTQYIYDGDEVIAEYDGGGALAAEYVTGAALDEVLLMDRGGARYYYVHDGLGSVTGLSDGAGTMLETYDYDPYGTLTTAASAVGNPYFFTSRRLDDETGLYHYRARAYDAGMGRFLQRDPIGYSDSMNLYEYVWNSPNNYIDPWGLEVYSPPLPLGMPGGPGAGMPTGVPPAPNAPILELPPVNPGDHFGTGDSAGSKSKSEPKVCKISPSGGDPDDDDPDDPWWKRVLKRLRKRLRDERGSTGGSKHERQPGLRGYPKRFQRWFHRNKPKGQKNTSPGEIKEYYEIWKQFEGK